MYERLFFARLGEALSRDASGTALSLPNVIVLFSREEGAGSVSLFQDGKIESSVIEPATVTLPRN